MRNIGTYRMQVYDRHSTAHALAASRPRAGRVRPRRGAAGQAPRSGGRARRQSDTSNISATAPMPEGLDELMLAGVLSKRRVELVQVHANRSRSAHAGPDELFSRVTCEPGERRREGHFTRNGAGLYSLADDFPVFHLTCLTMRRNPVYVTTVVGIPPRMNLPRHGERACLPAAHPQDASGNRHARFSSTTFVFDKRYRGDARKIMSAFWGLGQLMFVSASSWWTGT